MGKAQGCSARNAHACVVALGRMARWFLCASSQTYGLLLVYVFVLFFDCMFCFVLLARCISAVFACLAWQNA